MIEASAPPGLRPDRGTVAERAVILERAAIAFGLTWRGLSVAQGALLVIHAARALAGFGSAEAERFAAVADRFAAERGLSAFSAGVAHNIMRFEHLAALRRQGQAG